MCIKERTMCVHPISALNFKAGKIELKDITTKDLSNLDSIAILAKKHYCDVLIEKKSCTKQLSDFNVFYIIARRKWINPKYIYSYETTSIKKMATAEEASNKILETVQKTFIEAKSISHKLAQKFIAK